MCDLLDCIRFNVIFPAKNPLASISACLFFPPIPPSASVVFICLFCCMFLSSSYLDSITVLICCVKELLLLLLCSLSFLLTYLCNTFCCWFLVLFCFVCLLRLGTLLLDLHGICFFVFIIYLCDSFFGLFPSAFCFCFVFVCLFCFVLFCYQKVFDRVRKGRFRVRNSPDSFSCSLSLSLCYWLSVPPFVFRVRSSFQMYYALCVCVHSLTD